MIVPDSFLVTSKIDDLYFTDATILYWFLGVELILLFLIFIKNKK